MVRFCPRCGSVLMPKGGFLVCPRCGYRVVMDSRAAREYAVKYRVDESKRVKTANGVVETGRRRASEEEREAAREYYEILLDMLAEEE